MKKLITLLFFTTCLQAQLMNTLTREADIDLQEKLGGIFEVKVTIDDIITIPFILDTGASEVCLPSYIIYTLIKCEKIKEEDQIDNKTFILADGRSVESKRFIIKSLKIGKYLFKNVTVSMSNSINSPALLGQNILKQMKVIELNYVKKQ